MAKQPAKRGRGRPPLLDKALTGRLYVRLHPDEKALLESAASAAGERLSDWIREALLKAARRIVG